ncbi:MAG: ABC transporter substrate-binding protein [Pararhodobacter sp.]|nr:ABC transporter substrate-binding protein [Pararhodobacter sp.]
MKQLKTLVAAAAVMALAGGAQAQTRGVSDTEIVIGGAHDLSGVFAAISTPAVNGANLYFDALNAEGGVHGRTIRYIVEDHGYQLPRATQAFNKLIERDRVFFMLSNLGTPHNVTHYPLMERRQVPNLFPLTAARQVLPEPPGMNFALIGTYHQEMIEGLRYLQAERGIERVCSMYLPTDFGEEIFEGTRDGAELLGLELVDQTTHSPNEQDFVGALTRLRSAGCDAVTLALGIRATITVYVTAQRLGWTDAVFMVSSAGFHEAVAGVPGGATEGLFAAASWVDLQARQDEPAIADFVERYRARYNEQPGGFGMLGYASARIIHQALEAAGRDLTLESFMEGMYSIDFFDDLLDVQISFSPDDHRGSNIITISTVEDGVWQLVERL